MQATTDNQCIIRQMQIADVDIVSAIDNLGSIEPWDKKTFISCLKVYNSYVATINDPNNSEIVVGFGVIALYQNINQAHILNVGVDINLHHQGIGNKILDYLIKLCTLELNIHKIFLEVCVHNQIAINLYKKFKFKEIGLRKNYYVTKNGKEDALILVFDLDLYVESDNDLRG